MSEKIFRGPLFIVGMSRSGTKLLREILNKNPDIGIPSAETHFIPYSIKRYGNQDFGPDSAARKEFLDILFGSSFYEKMRKNGYLPDIANEKDWMCTSDFSEFLEKLLRFCSGKADKNNRLIWGDKTPNHLLHMPLLKGIYSSAKFVHIIRDPRARVLSAKKAWGADIRYAADRWNRSILKAQEDALKLSADYKEVFYEELVEDPKKVISSVCQFIGVPFDASMLILDKPVENRGGSGSDTRVATTILPDNKSKYFAELTTAEIRRVEEIAYPMAKKLGYINECSSVKHVPLTGMERIYSRINDRTHTLHTHIRDMGFTRAVGFLKWHRKVDG